MDARGGTESSHSAENTPIEVTSASPWVDTSATNILALPPSDTNETFISYISSSNRWDQWHKRWSSNVVGVAAYVDRFFGDRSSDEVDTKTQLKLKVGVQFKEATKPDFIHKASLKLSLPSLNERLQLVVEDIFDPDEPLDEIERDVLSTDSSDTDAALRYNLWDELDIKLDADLGVRFGSPSQAYLRLRASRDFEITRKLELRLIQSVRWFTSDGFVSETEMQWNKRMGWDWLFRSSSELEWREDRPGVRPTQIFSLFKTFSRHRGIRMDVGATWPESPKPVDRLYYTTVSFRKRIHSDWLYMELKPGVQFFEPLDYDPQYTFAIQFEVIMGSFALWREQPLNPQQN